MTFIFGCCADAMKSGEAMWRMMRGLRATILITGIMSTSYTMEVSILYTLVGTLVDLAFSLAALITLPPYKWKPRIHLTRPRWVMSYSCRG